MIPAWIIFDGIGILLAILCGIDIGLKHFTDEGLFSDETGFFLGTTTMVCGIMGLITLSLVH